MVGIDEVGRGALAGPMTVGVVVLNCVASPPPGLTDSKLLTPAKRRALVEPLEAWAADWSLGHVSAAEIDAWGLRLALAVAAGRALEGLSIVPTIALIDGSFNLLRAPHDVRLGAEAPPVLSFQELAVTTVVKGDRACASIAAASVLAKVCRDELMVALADEFDPYGWRQNKGYGVEAGRLLIAHAFRRESLQKLYARLDPGNRGARKVLQRAGFRYEGCLRREKRLNGRWIDQECWGLLRSEWRKK